MYATFLQRHLIYCYILGFNALCQNYDDWGFMLIIKRKKFSGKLTSEILSTMVSLIKQLPEPTILSHERIITKADETVLCLQREVAYLDEFNFLSNINYIGTQKLDSCIFLYVYSETDHLVMHVDEKKQT